MKIFTRDKFIHYFLRYFSVIALAVAINVIGYFAAVNVLEEQVSENDMNALENTRMLCDEYLSRIQKISFSVLNSKTVSMLAKPDLSEEKESEYLQLLMDEIANYHLEAETFTVMFRNKDLCVHSDMGVLNTSLLYTTEYKKYYDYETVWEDSLFARPGINCQILTPTTGGKSKVMMVQYVPTISKDIVLIAGINDSMFANMVSKAREGEIYLCSDDSTGIWFSSVDFNDLIREIERGDYLKLEVKSDFGLHYIKYTKKSLYLSAIRKVRTMFILGIMLSLLIVGFVAYMVARKNYKTELKLREENEKHIISRRNEALKKMLSNKNLSDEEKTYIGAFARQLGTPLTLGLIEMFDDNVSKEFEKYISNFLQNSVESEIVVRMQNGDIVCIINSADKVSETLFRSLSEKIKKDFGIRAVCSISDESDDFEDINKLYVQAQEASLEYSLNSEESVFVYKRTETGETDEDFDLQKEAKLIELLKSGNEKDACAMIEKFIGRSNENKDKIVFSKILCVIFDVCDKVNIDDNSEIRHICESLYHYCNSEEYYKYKKKIYEYVSVLCKYTEKNTGNDNRDMSIYAKEKCQEIKKYIDENFSDTTLNVNSVAQTFGLSRSWVSVNFKKNFDMTISTYIVQCRITKAKELLATEMSIGNIAEACGFADKTVYYRTFRKCENMTSNEYRALLKLNGSEE